jgi:Protein of unknown function (DUF2721)
MLDHQTVRDVLSAMITPAVLISASGTLVLSTTNRLGRVVDRVRALTGDAESIVRGTLQLPDEELKDKRTLIIEQISKLTRRIRLLQKAVTILYTAIGLLISTSIAVGLEVAFPLLPGHIPITFGLIGATAILYASVLLVKEARVAVESTLHELSYVKKVVARTAGRAELRT